MADEFKEVTTTGLGQRMGNSLVGILVGITLFFGSFALLYWNEGRTDLSVVAKTAIPVQADSAAPADTEGKLVSVSGVFQSKQMVGDGLFLKPGLYMAVERNVEMYSWTEEKETKTKKNLGGSETTETTYRYKKEWTGSPDNSDDFKHPEGHYNPSMPFKSEEFRADTGTIGQYDYDLRNIDLPPVSKLTLTSGVISLKQGAKLANPSFLYKGKGSLDNPVVGDVRVSYSVLKPGFKGTVFGNLNAPSVTAYMTKKNEKLYRIFPTDRETAIQTLHQEYVFMMWLFRILGFAAMWFGLSLVFGPISTFLDIVPVIGSITRFVAAGISFLIALPLTIVTIIVSMLAHNLIALAVALVITAGIIIFILMSRKKKVAATAK